jgi:hypothetical protein
VAEEDNRCKADWDRRHEAMRDNGVTEELGLGMSRRIEFEVGYDHRAFPEDCGGGGHGQHGMGLAFIFFGPEGAVQWKVSLTEWTPREVGMLGGLPTRYPQLDSVHPVDLGYHWRTPTYEGQELFGSVCEYLKAPCYYDGSALNVGPILEKFLNYGPHAVWAELARYYNQVKEAADDRVETS